MNCPQCGERCATPYELANHVVVEHEKTPREYRCPWCGAGEIYGPRSMLEHAGYECCGYAHNSPVFGTSPDEAGLLIQHYHDTLMGANDRCNASEK